MVRERSLVRSAVTVFATLAGVLSCGCRPTIPDDPTYCGQALVVPVKQYPRYSDTGRMYGPGSLSHKPGFPY
jgi:hypothetical protein